MPYAVPLFDLMQCIRCKLLESVNGGGMVLGLIRKCVDVYAVAVRVA